jgi:hypothetical protein
MAKIDQEQERKRLQERFAAMNDLELQKVAKGYRGFTEWAFQEFSAEMKRRALDWPGKGKIWEPIDEPVVSSEKAKNTKVVGQDATEPDELGEPSEPIALRSYRDMTEALTDRMVLEGAGIECYLFDENMIRLDWLWSNLLGGLKLIVKKSDAAEAEKVLQQSVPETFDVEGVGQYDQPRCPQCGSMDVSYEGLMKRVAGAGMLIGLPITVKMKGWNCHSCEHQWGIEEIGKSEKEGATPA